MLTHFPVGPNEDQCYLVAYMLPGTKVASVVMEHLTKQSAISEAQRLNIQAENQEKAIQADRALRLRGVA